MYGNISLTSSSMAFTIGSLLGLGNLGNVGVRIFFVLSGYLITGLLLKELDSTNKIHLGKFYLRRSLRIFPAFYFFLLVMVVARVADLVFFSNASLAYAATYTMNYCQDCGWTLFHSWSLGVEEQFYLIYPALLFMAGRRRAPCILLTLLVVSPMLRAYFWLSPNAPWFATQYGFLNVADALAVGCLLAFFRDRLKQHAAYNRLLQSRLFWLVPVAILMLNSLGVHPSMLSSQMFLLLGIPVMNLLIVASLDWAITNSTGPVGRVLNSSPLVLVGVLSYSIYLWQQPFLAPAAPTLWSSFPQNLVFIGAAALGSYYFVERSGFRLRRKLEERFLHSKTPYTAENTALSQH